MPRFDSTQWSVVVRARGDSADARAALERLCRTYRPPVLAYIRGRARGADVEDLAQAFFTRFVEDAYHADADPARGRFRAFLLTALKRFLIDADAEARTLKRGGGARIDCLDDDDVIADDKGPEQEFERSWAMAALDAALRRLRGEAEAAGKTAMFDRLREFLTEAPDEADYARAAAELNMRRNTLAVAVHRLRHRLRELVRDELCETTCSRDELETEVRALRSTLAVVVAPEGTL